MSIKICWPQGFAPAITGICVLLLASCALPAGPPPTRRAATVTRAARPAATLLIAPSLETAATLTAPVANTATAVASTPTPTTAATLTNVPTAEPSATPAPSAEPAAAQSVGALSLKLLVDGLENPTDLTHAADGSGNLYVLEQPGRIRLITGALLAKRPFMDIEDRVGSGGNEQGLLGLAFAPDYTSSRRFFVNYTDKDGDTIIAGFIASEDGRSADPASEWQVLKIEQPYANHNGGQIKFGPDGMLYIGMGDGGSGGDPQNYAQNPKSLLGKMLRIDVSQSSKAAPYSVPAGNPTFGTASLPELWSIGLRNPWRFSFDRENGALFVADVGQNKIEEINYQPPGRAGDNYGWKLREGTAEFSGELADYLIEPVTEYTHGDDGCSVTGGYVYRGPTLGTLQGSYVYGDYCSGKVWQLRQRGTDWQNIELFDTDYRISSFGEDEQGEIYLLDRDGGVYRVTAE